MELAGRDRELAAAAEAVEDVRGGRSRVLAVLGEAGIGKTALLAAITERARGSLEVLRTVTEDLPDREPFALVVDESSLVPLANLLRRPPAAPHLLVFAARPDASGLHLLGLARSAPGFAEIELSPLDEDAAARLLAEVRDPAVRRRIAGEAGGNPLLLRELARGNGAPTRTLVAAVATRVAALPGPAQTLLQGAAVAGDPFDPELAAAAAGLIPDAEALDRLAAAGLVRATGVGRGFAFSHAAVRRVVYAETPPAWRLDAHERMAAELARRGATAGARAEHLAHAARPGDEASIALLADAARAAAEGAPATAARWYAAALRLLPDVGDEGRRAALLAPRALALAAAGRLQESREALVGVLDLLGPGAGAQRLELALACARVEAQLGRHGDARRRLHETLALAAPERQATLAFELAADAMTHDRLGDVGAWAERAADDADPLLLAGADALRALAATGGADGACAALDRATARLADLDDAALAADPGVALQVGRAQLRLQRFGAASATLARTLAVCRQTQQGHLLVHVRTVLALALWLGLDLDAALAQIEAAEEGARRDGGLHQRLLTVYARALVHHHRGEADEAERAAGEYAALARSLPANRFTRVAACNLAGIRADADPERAICELVAAAGPRLEQVDDYWASSLLLTLVRAGIALGRIADAERWADEAAARARDRQLPANAVRAACARAEVLLARGDACAAAAVAARAVTAAERIPAPLDAADARLLAGRALAAAGEAGRAKAALQRVAADAGRGGALRLRDAARRELRRLGTRVSAAGRRAAHGAAHDRLSQREREIAELVAQGNSNKQVAGALFLSEKTVQNALTRVYAKLGVRSRTQLARAVITAE